MTRIDYPITCSSCGSTNITFGKCKDFGIKDFKSGYVYFCHNCGAYVGTHINRPQEALGTPANRKTRVLRNKCHEEFDKHWETSTERRIKYHILAIELGIEDSECHFGMMDEKMLKKAIGIIKNW